MPLGPAVGPRSPTVWFSVLKDAHLFVAMRRYCRSLGGGEVLYWHELTFALSSTGKPLHGGLVGGIGLK